MDVILKHRFVHHRHGLFLMKYLSPDCSQDILHRG